MSKLYFLFLLAACSAVDLDPFIRNLQSANLHELEIGLVENPPNVFTEVYTVTGFPLEAFPGTSGLERGFIRHGIAFTFVRSLDSDRALYRYAVGSRRPPDDGRPSEIAAFIGFRLYKNGLYQMDKINPDQGITYESTVAWYGEGNVNFQRMVPVPLYQRPGTAPAYTSLGSN